jgi:hypothetical protein
VAVDIMAVVLVYLAQEPAVLPLQVLLAQLVQQVIQEAAEVAEHMVAVEMVIQLAKVVL